LGNKENEAANIVKRRKRRSLRRMWFDIGDGKIITKLMVANCIL
jgi:hypothetical protein